MIGLNSIPTVIKPELKGFEPLIEVVLSVAFSLAVAVGMFFYAQRQLTKKAKGLMDNALKKAPQQIKDYLSNEENSDFIDGLLTPVAQRVAENLKSVIFGTVGGLQSGEIRAEKALNKAIGTDMVEQVHPLAGVLLKQFPSVKKAIAKNPELVRALPAVIEQWTGKSISELAAPFMGGAQGSKPGTSSGNGQTQIGVF